MLLSNLFILFLIKEIYNLNVTSPFAKKDNESGLNEN
jgi:hypothetical protein